MQRLSPIHQTLYSELAQRSLDARFASDFPVEGRFVRVTVDGRGYWYFDRPPAGGGPRQRRAYVGPVDDGDVTRRVEGFKDLKTDVRERRRLVGLLVRDARLPRPDAITGAVVAALAEAGFFRLRGVLVGTVAFQTYPALLGLRLPAAPMQTGDIDFAQFQSISVAVGDSLPPMLDVLTGVDATFREIPDLTDGRQTARYVSRSGYRVEFLTPNTGPDEIASRPAPMPALGGASARALRFLDFLIHEPERAVLLHGAGIPVLVPSPERYAVHKLILASRRLRDRDGLAKSDKDRWQARSLMEAMLAVRRGEALADAFMEAWDRGPAWREALGTSLRMLDAEVLSELRDGLAGGVRALGADPVRYGLADASP